MRSRAALRLTELILLFGKYSEYSHFRSGSHTKSSQTFLPRSSRIGLKLKRGRCCRWHVFVAEGRASALLSTPIASNDTHLLQKSNSRTLELGPCIIVVAEGCETLSATRTATPRERRWDNAIENGEVLT